MFLPNLPPLLCPLHTPLSHYPQNPPCLFPLSLSPLAHVNRDIQTSTSVTLTSIVNGNWMSLTKSPHRKVSQLPLQSLQTTLYIIYLRFHIGSKGSYLNSIQNHSPLIYALLSFIFPFNSFMMFSSTRILNKAFHIPLKFFSSACINSLTNDLMAFTMDSDKSHGYIMCLNPKFGLHILISSVSLHFAQSPKDDSFSDQHDI